MGTISWVQPCLGRCFMLLVNFFVGVALNFLFIFILFVLFLGVLNFHIIFIYFLIKILVNFPATRRRYNIVSWLSYQFIINHQALPCLLTLLTNNYKKSIKKEACWTISNITAGNKEQIQVREVANTSYYKQRC